VLCLLIASARWTATVIRRPYASARPVGLVGTGDQPLDHAPLAILAAAMDCCLVSRCLWCREPVGWSTYARLWLHLPSGRLACAGNSAAWASADPQFTTRPGPVQRPIDQAPPADRPHPPAAAGRSRRTP